MTPENHPETEKPLTIIHLEVEAFQRIKAANILPAATGLIPVRGRNAQGKSSLIESMIAALMGKSGSSALPINADAHGAEVLLDLGEITVSRKWTRGSGGEAKTKLVVEAADGSPFKSPQAVLDGLVGQFADPVAFLGLPPAEQVKTVLASIGLDEPLKQLEDRAAGWYDKRRDLGRECDRARKAFAAIDEEIQGLPSAESAAPIEELVQRLKEAKAHNSNVEALRVEQQTIVREGQKVAARITQIEKQIEELQQELVTSKVQKVELSEAFTKTRDKLSGAEIYDTEEIESQIESFEEVAKANARREFWKDQRAEYERALGARDKADARLEGLRAEISELLGKAPFPVDGMSYNNEAKVLTIGGIPFANASQAERLKAAATIAMAGTPRIRVLFVREGSLLDDESLAMLGEMVEAWGGQLWCEIVDSNRDGVGIYIEDGEVYSGEAEE